MKEQFKAKAALSPASMDMLLKINSILEEYKRKGYTLTLRQLYYQLVSRAIIPNADKEYKKISKLLGEGRMAGIVDWASIEDRLRRPKRTYVVKGVEDAIRDAHRTYRTDLHSPQQSYVEVWIEKDALSSIFERVTDKYCVRLMVNRGYSSISAMYDASKRFRWYGMNEDKPSTILYFGDHDPSGKDMVRDITDRLAEFGVTNLEVRPCALNMDQVRQYNPPPDPAKITDPRAKWYIAEYGDHSWELDALRPEVLVELVEQNMASVIDINLHLKEANREGHERLSLEKLANYVEENGIDSIIED